MPRVPCGVQLQVHPGGPQKGRPQRRQEGVRVSAMWGPVRRQGLPLKAHGEQSPQYPFLYANRVWHCPVLGVLLGVFFHMPPSVNGRLN